MAGHTKAVWEKGETGWRTRGGIDYTEIKAMFEWIWVSEVKEEQGQSVKLRKEI